MRVINQSAQRTRENNRAAAEAHEAGLLFLKSQDTKAIGVYGRGHSRSRQTLKVTRCDQQDKGNSEASAGGSGTEEVKCSYRGKYDSHGLKHPQILLKEELEFPLQQQSPA